jgi:hypothetical protein
LLVPRPTLARLLELVAAILDLEDGRLKLVYRHGRLEAWLVDGGVRTPAELASFDGPGDRLVTELLDHGRAARGRTRARPRLTNWDGRPLPELPRQNSRITGRAAQPRGRSGFKLALGP